MPKLTAGRVLSPIVVLVIAFGIASCGGGDDSTSTEAGATSAETEAETGSENEAEGSTPAPSGDAQRSEKVEIVDFAYNPDPVTIEEGGKVIWMNEDPETHTATADDGSFDTGDLEEGKLKSETFKEPGEFTYHCEIHPTMHGTVKVVPAA